MAEIVVAGQKVTFGTVSELNAALKRKADELGASIERHESTANAERKARKEILKMLGENEAKKGAGGAPETTSP